MADRLPQTIKCGDGDTGHGEVTSISATYKWIDEIGYGRAHDDAVAELDQRDAQNKAEVVDKVNRWIEKVRCVDSSACQKCHKVMPFDVQAADVESEDKVHKLTGSPLKKRTLSLARTYKITSGYVRCMCPGQIIVAARVVQQPMTQAKRRRRE